MCIRDSGRTVRGIEAIAENRAPVAVMKASQLRYAVSITVICAAGADVDARDRCTRPLDNHSIFGIGGAFIKCGRIRHIERVNYCAARAETTDEPRMPIAFVKEVARAWGTVHEKVVAVPWIRQIERRINTAGAWRDVIAANVVDAAEDSARHVGEHFGAIVFHIDEVISLIHISEP